MLTQVKQVVPTSVKRAYWRVSREAHFRQRLGKAPPVLVYQMGKVGSTSVFRSVKADIDGPIMWAHALGSNHPEGRTRQVYQWAVVERRPIKIISLTREPIGRNISAFFQNFDEVVGPTGITLADPIPLLSDLFLARFWHGLPIHWFDLNIRRHFNIDVYDSPFPDEGFAHYSEGNVELLIMRAELDDRHKEEAIGRFLNLPEFHLINANITAEKPQAAAYHAFRQQVRLPPDLVNWLCRSRYFTHFYDQDFIDRVRLRWSSPPSGVPVTQERSVPISTGEV